MTSCLACHETLSRHLDTNVILAALRSQAGASYRLLMTAGHPQWQSVVTPALMYQYEDVARRPGNVPGLSAQDITDILDLIYRESHRQVVWFSWRPACPPSPQSHHRDFL